MSQDKSKNTARKGYNTTLRIDLMKRLRVLAAQLDKKQNDLIEDAILDYLNKNEKKVKD
jgi:predicted transcriptional regulator